MVASLYPRSVVHGIVKNDSQDHFLPFKPSMFHLLFPLRVYDHIKVSMQVKMLIYCGDDCATVE